MRSILASIFRLTFSIKPLRYFYFGLHNKIFFPFKLFRGVTKQIYYRRKFRLILDLNDWIPQNIYFLGNYEEKEINFLEKILKNGNTFIDVGANIGIFSLAASDLVGSQGSVFSFEPFSSNFNNLKNHIEINNLKNVTLERLAVSDKSGEISLHINDKEHNSGMATAFATDFTHSETVSAISLDDYVSQKGIASVKAIKLDIEGGEYPALIGMRRMLEKFHPTIIIEINPEILSATSFNKKDIEEFLYGLSYNKKYIDNSGELIDTPLKDDTSCNYVFI